MAAPLDYDTLSPADYDGLTADEYDGLTAGVTALAVGSDEGGFFMIGSGEGAAIPVGS